MLTRRQRYCLDLVKPPKQAPELRVHNWNEVYFSYAPELAMQEAQRCLLCEHAPCQKACPVNNDIPSALFLLGQGDIIGAAEKFWETSNLPDVCGRICPQEKLCEGACIVGANKPPVTIGKLEAFTADYVRTHYGYPRREPAPSTGFSVAVIGAGPAGLAVAEELTARGHGVTVFDAWPFPGGLLMYGIPNFKLNKETVFAKIQYLEDMGVKFVCNYRVGKERGIDEMLRSQGYDMVFLGYGAVKGGEMRVAGENLANVYQATEYLVRGNLPPELLPQPWADSADPRPYAAGVTVVIGGGDTGMDCVRTARRLNPNGKVYCLYRRSESEMVGRMEERLHAKEEGVAFEYLTLPIRLVGDERGVLTAAECVRMELGKPDAKGRRSPVPVAGTNFVIPCDTAVLAIGYSAETEIPEATPGLSKTPWGTILVVSEETGETSREDVFAAGDNVRGADLVVTALAFARKAALTMHAKLMVRSSLRAA